MCNQSYIIIFIFILLIIDSFIYYDTNNLVELKHKISRKPKIVIIGSQHGNERAGSHAINQLNNEILSGKLNLKQGEVIMYPFVNKYGSYIRHRNTPSIMNSVDLNRTWYSDKRSEYPMIEELKYIISDADLVIDCHEGWGYHISNRYSMGSCLFCTHKKQIPLCDKIVKKINHSITNPKKLFLSRGMTNDLLNKPSLRTYCANKNIPNILIETSGIGEIQPLKIRQGQQYLILTECLKHYNIL